jgi:predicted nucleic acid-binding protein
MATVMGKKKGRAEEFVLDSSVTLAWFFKDEGTAYDGAVGKRLTEARAVVPAVWPYEIANAILVGERRERTREGDAAKWLRYLATLPIVVEPQPPPHTWGTVLDLARARGLTVYDAAYLELALHRGVALATLDDQLREAADAVGVPLYLGG